jgi:hypothetical protein
MLLEYPTAFEWSNSISESFVGMTLVSKLKIKKEKEIKGPSTFFKRNVL